MKIKDIARIAGVSPATVSRVINHPEMVREETRKRVLSVIERYGYEPNRMAKALRVRRSGNIGLIVPIESGSVFESPYFGLLLRGISSELERFGYHLVLSTSHQEDVEIYRSFMKKGIVDAFIVVDVLDEDPRIDFLKGSEFPFVVIGRPLGFEELLYVDSDNFEGSRMATEYLLKRGRKKIAFVNGPVEHSVSRWRLEGYKKALEDSDSSFELILNGKFTEDSGYELTLEALKSGADAILYAGDVMAFGGMVALREKGLEVGKDVAIVGFDDVPAARIVEPPLSSVRQPVVEIGRYSVKLVVDILSGKRPESRVFPTRLVIRESS